MGFTVFGLNGILISARGTVTHRSGGVWPRLYRWLAGCLPVTPGLTGLLRREIYFSCVAKCYYTSFPREADVLYRVSIMSRPVSRCYAIALHHLGACRGLCLPTPAADSETLGTVQG